MLPINDNYFSPELIEGGHYIITGLLGDNYINDLYQMVDVNQTLHNELINNDFDIIVYYDYINKLFCYDERSAYLLSHANEDPSPKTNTSRRSNISGPLGLARGRRTQQSSNDTTGASYNLRRMTIEIAWPQVISLIRQTRYRCAIVFSNILGLTGSFPVEALQALTELNATVTDRPHAAFYVFHSADGANFAENDRSHNPNWNVFFNQFLKPLFDTNDPSKNRVIRLSTPNAAEVRNLLNMLRVRKNNKLKISIRDFQRVAELVSYASATNNLSLRALKVAIEEYIKNNPGVALTPDNYQLALGVKAEKTALEEIQSLIGLDNVKSWVQEWARSRKNDGLARSFPEKSSRFYPNVKSTTKNGLVLNIVFTGKPGTGKSTLAKQIGRLYYELGILPRGHLVECSASNIVSQNVGGTAPLVRQRVMEAMGGVLMIDEAYAISKNSHGKEAIDQLVNEMTQYAGQFAVVICGYEAPMKKFLNANQGLASRFATQLHLEDYTAEEMEQIFRTLMSNEDENGYVAEFDEELESIFSDFCDNWANDHDHNWGNAREATTLLANMKRKALARMAARGERVENSRLILTKDDVPLKEERHLKQKPKDVKIIVDDLKNEIGLSNVKKRLLAIAQSKSWGVGSASAGRFIFHGPPGTGKTHMARKFCNLLFRLGLIKRNFVYEVSAKQLCHPDPEFDYGLDNGRAPTIAEILEAAFENAKGGIIFIDEAPQLLDSDLGRNVIRALVPIIERPDVRENTCVILAGYSDKISYLLSEDDGLESRFPKINRIRFDNYTASELAKLSEVFAKASGHSVDKDFLNRTRAAFSKYLENPEENFGNARFIKDTYIPAAIEVKSARLLKQSRNADEKSLENNIIATEKDLKNIEMETRAMLTGEDIPAPFDKLAGPPQINVPELTLKDKIESLFGKQEIKDYLYSLSKDNGEVNFYDDIQISESNFAIIGPTGSGRHTAARVIVAALKDAGIIERGDIHITSKGSFEAQYVGQTIPKTIAEIEKAKGGCMLVEHPSDMLHKSGTDNTFGIEALSTIGGAMSNSTDKISIIFIDDEDGFDALKKQFPSIVSKFSRVFHIENLTPEDMYRLFEDKTKYSMDIQEEVKDILPDFFTNWVSQRGGLTDDSAVWSGGAEVEKLITDIKNSWQNNNGVENENKRYITREHFPKALQKYLKTESSDKEDALTKLIDLPGLNSVKETVKAIEREMRMYKSRALPGFYAFVGDPGSGKTKVAKLFGRILRSTEVLSQGHVIERTANQLAQHPQSFEECLKLAKNGVLFIDEAPSLLKTHSGREIIDKLLTTIEDADIMKNLCIIIAGYEEAMAEMFKYDIGLQSRFEAPNAIVKFENYTADEMLEIMEHFAKNAVEDPYIRAPYKITLLDEFKNKSKLIFGIERERPNFGNGRFVRNYLKTCMGELLKRVDAMPKDVDKSDMKLLSTLTEADIPEKYSEILEASARKLEVSIDFRDIDTHTISPISDDNYKASLESIKRSTVLIIATAKDGNISTGTGFIISTQGHVLTCQHVFDGAESIKAKVYTPGAIGGDYHTFDVTPLYPCNYRYDMAIGKIDGSNFKPLPIRPYGEEILENEYTVMVCYPLGGTINGGDFKTLNPSHYDGKISGKQTSPTGVEFFCLDSSGMPGCSGSSVVSKKDGRVIGVFPGAIADNQDQEKSKYKVNVFYPIKYFWETFDVNVEDTND